jgi:hypothetical protein
MSSQTKKDNKATNSGSSLSEKEKEITVRAICELIAEVLFIILPFIVTGIVFTYKGESSRLLYMPEWSLAASFFLDKVL